MDQAEKEQILSQVEHKVGMIKTFHKDVPGADDLIKLHADYQKEGTSVTEIKLFLDDLNLFLESTRS
jgi:hypothetical protein